MSTLCRLESPVEPPKSPVRFALLLKLQLATLASVKAVSSPNIHLALVISLVSR